MSHNRRPFFRLSLALCLLLGCNSAKVAQPLTGKLGGSDPDAQMEFWHSLAGQPLTSNDEAFHGLLLYLDGEDPAADYAGRVRVMKDRRLLDRGFDQPAEQAVQRGTLATALVRALKVRGGVFQRLTNDHPRYAVRELMYLDLYPPSSPQQTFSGTEFLGIMGRVEDHQRGNPNGLPASVLPGERANPDAAATTRPAVPAVPAMQPERP